VNPPDPFTVTVPVAVPDGPDIVVGLIVTLVSLGACPTDTPIVATRVAELEVVLVE
jgi:hypothetical protein